MNAYIYQGALYCEHCAQSIMRDKAPNEDSDYYPQGPYGQGGGEADTPQHCDACGTFLENPLTPDGADYVREQLAAANIELEHDQSWSEIADACDHVGKPVLAQWVRFYFAPGM